mmetsp:Transcript_32983/g.78133  ORF Transcript_32983/g.78133 Transcript_32983/m.78133 type:complete len:96 (+) Transcript_32983:313-600(+)
MEIPTNEAPRMRAACSMPHLIARMQGRDLEEAAWAFVRARTNDIEVDSERERRGEADAKLVAARAGVSVASAREALRRARNDVVEAIMLLRDAMM